MGPRLCELCKNAQSKYKCLSCLVPYCSVVCFKKHKGPIRFPDKSCLVDEPSLVLHKKQLESLAFSSEIREALKDVELQKVIGKIDSSAGAENNKLVCLILGTDRAMENEFFHNFMEKVLSIISL